MGSNKNHEDCYSECGHLPEWAPLSSGDLPRGEVAVVIGTEGYGPLENETSCDLVFGGRVVVP